MVNLKCEYLSGTIAKYMDGPHETKKLKADKIALLGILITALLIARFVVGLRSAVTLSEPIELSRTGLAISVPAGNGWQSKKLWVYQEYGFILNSYFGTKLELLPDYNYYTKISRPYQFIDVTAHLRLMEKELTAGEKSLFSSRLK